MGDRDVQTVIRLQFLNTPGTEVAPGSDIIRENFQRDAIYHDESSYCLLAE